MDRIRAVTIMLLAIACTALTLAARVLGIFSFDRTAEHALVGWGSPPVMLFMDWISLPGDGWIPAILVGAVAAICIIKGRWLEAGFVIATLGSTLLSIVLKILVARPRPSGVPVDPTSILHAFNGFAYPSGHVLFYVVFFGFLAYLTWNLLRGPARTLILAACLLFIGMVGPSRVILGEHWVSDAIGGYLLGAAWVLHMIFLYEKMRTCGAGRQAAAP